MMDRHTDVATPVEVGVDPDSVGAKAAALGHEVAVKHVGKRFKLTCSCGWSVPPTATRFNTYRLAGDHVIAVVLAEKNRQKSMGVFPPEPALAPVESDVEV